MDGTVVLLTACCILLYIYCLFLPCWWDNITLLFYQICIPLQIEKALDLFCHRAPCASLQKHRYHRNCVEGAVRPRRARANLAEEFSSMGIYKNDPEQPLMREYFYVVLLLKIVRAWYFPVFSGWKSPLITWVCPKRESLHCAIFRPIHLHHSCASWIVDTPCSNHQAWKYGHQDRRLNTGHHRHHRKLSSLICHLLFFGREKLHDFAYEPLPCGSRKGAACGAPAGCDIETYEFLISPWARQGKGMCGAGENAIMW